MLYRIKTVDGVKTKVPLAGSTPAGLPVGSILSTYKKIQPYNYLYCDGSTFDENQYPELYLYLGTNVLPDYRECVPVGAEKNTTDIFDSTETDPSTGLPGTQSHDVFTQGQFKDDQLQNITGDVAMTVYAQDQHGAFGIYNDPAYYQSPSLVGGVGMRITFDASRIARTGTTTRTKEKAVFYYIKAVDGVDIADEDTFLNTVVNTIQDTQSYSTTEQKTGGKWIDGKDIYRRVIDETFYATTTDTLIPNTSGLNIDSIVSSNWYVPSEKMYLAPIKLFVQNGSLYIRSAIVLANVRNLVTIEYTKNE